MKQTTFEISQTFRSGDEEKRKRLIQEKIDRYLQNKIENS